LTEKPSGGLIGPKTHGSALLGRKGHREEEAMSDEESKQILRNIQGELETLRVYLAVLMAIAVFGLIVLLINFPPGWLD
jgi:hypothetical protein